ncbi:membrane protein insertion efficiency factor YidD [Pseudomonas asuensis]|uniref:membrane protein insertion efficiency factor YidD n=1 Tax=Pseudomonas asuensis TaxID=1825787 RepID=UPI001662DF96|nr:membrane protein insertion efficiency factor YidD [Pseudomonas asuensis]
MREPASLLIRFYRNAITSMMAFHCRFYPSCSNHTSQGIALCNFLRNGWMAIHQFGCCHFRLADGYDSVPADQSQAPTS